MTDQDRIKEGDLVQVDFNNSQVTLCKSAKVLAVQYNLGEPWVFKDEQSGFIYYVSEGCTLTKQVPKP